MLIVLTRRNAETETIPAGYRPIDMQPPSATGKRGKTAPARAVPSVKSGFFQFGRYSKFSQPYITSLSHTTLCAWVVASTLDSLRLI